jgi:hypothetical protein
MEDATTFDKLLEPVQPFVDELAQKLTPHHNEKYFFPEFFRIMIFYFVSGIPSAKLLINGYLKEDLLQSELNLAKVPYSTFSDAFERFGPDLFKSIFISLLGSISLMSVPEFSTLGLLYCVDGSLFPTLCSMSWAEYKKNSNAIRLHLCFELNRMIPADFIIGSGNSSERKALRKMLTAGATYIADRGYGSFKIFHDIKQAQAHFVIRVKSNWLYTTVSSLTPELSASLNTLFSDVSDQTIKYDNDPYSNVWRLVRFYVCGEVFCILTDRLDLSTFQVIMLYACRWQVELFFRFLKRTMNGIHLIKHNETGVTIQFYAILITALLQLKLKQDAIIQKDQADERGEIEDLGTETKLSNSSQECEKENDSQSDKSISQTYQFFKMIGEKVDKYWKISIYWLTALRQFLYRPYDERAIEILGSG